MSLVFQLVDVDVSPATARRTSMARPSSASSVGSRRKLKLKVNAIEPTTNISEDRKTEKSEQNKEKMNNKIIGPPRRLIRHSTQPEYRPTGLPSEVFGAPISKTRRKVLERTASDSHTDELEYNDIMEEIIKEQMESKEHSLKIAIRKPIRSPTPEFLSLARQFSDESTCNVDSGSKHYDSPTA